MSSIKMSFNGVEVSANSDGQVFIDSSGSLTRLNYFDGKFLRATDLQLEQTALLNQIRLANRAAGGGLIHGFSCTLGGGQQIRISAGLGYDWQGRALLLGQDITLSLSDLLDTSAGISQQSGIKKVVTDRDFRECEIAGEAPDPENIVTNEQLYLIVISHVEAYCGEEDVFGKICSEACISSTQRSHIVEGIRISAVPLSLTQSLKTSTQVTLTRDHLRSRTVSAYFAQERASIASLISQQGLSANTWCLGAEALGGEGIAIAMLSKTASSIAFLDAWSVRRERMDTPSKQYWAMRMGMRSWQIYLAQILQFQCHLRDRLNSIDPDNPRVATDPCAEEKAMIKTAASDMQKLVSYYSKVSARLTQVERLPQADIATLDIDALNASIARLQAVGAASISQQVLIDWGIVELPSAGYLPVVANSSLSINTQIRQMMGNGVNLRFCAVRADFVHLAIEEAQHMERICLLSGLDNAENRQDVDILVPDGEIDQSHTEQFQPGFQAHLDSTATALGMLLHMVADAFGDALDKTSARNELVMNSVSAARASTARDTQKRAIDFSDINLSVGRLQVGETMSGSARAELLDDNRANSPAFYLAASNASSTHIDGQTITTDINFWGEMRSDKDVFKLARNGRAQVTSRFLMEASFDYAGGNRNIKMDIIIELTISGQVIIEDVKQTGSTKTLSGRFIGDCTLKYTTSQDGERETKVSSSSLNDTISFATTPNELGSNIEIIIPSPALFGDSDLFNMVYKQTWNAAGECEVLAYVSAKTDKGEQQQNFIDGKFIPDTNALKPGNIFYNKSLTALNQIAGALNNSGFVETASHLLFPPPVSKPDDLRVKGSYPWVVFHRRRAKDCGDAAAADSTVSTRRYQIYQLPLANEFDLEKLIATVESRFDQVIAKAEIVSEAVFSANSQVLNSAHQSLQQAWTNNVGNGKQVVLAAIASQGDVLSEGDSLARARVTSTNTALEPVTDFDSNLTILVRRTLPPRVADGLDGAIVYFVHDALVEVQTDCHAVYHVLTEQPDVIGEQLQSLIKKYQSGDTSINLDMLFNQDKARRLTVKPQFIADSGEFASEQEINNFKNAWVEAGNYRATHAGALHAQEDAQAASSVRKQTETLTEVTGFINRESDDNIATIAVPSGMLDECQRATVLVSAIQCHDVYLVGSAGRDDRLIPGQEVTDAERASLDVILQDLDTGWGRGQIVYYRLNQIDFYWRSSELESGSQQAFLNNWRQYLEASPSLASAINGQQTIGFYSSVKQTTNADGNASHSPDEAEVKTQSEKLARVMDIGTSRAHFAHLSQRDSFPVDCPVITFIVVDPAQQSLVVTAGLARATRFDDNNEVIRDDTFEASIRELKSNSTQITEIELLSDDKNAESVKAADARARALTRARALKKILQEEGISTRMAKVSGRAPTPKESNSTERLLLKVKSS